MMDIIREEDAARPVSFSAASLRRTADWSSLLQKVTRQEVLNPYESADNPMARIPRSRPARPVSRALGPALPYR